MRRTSTKSRCVEFLVYINEVTFVISNSKLFEKVCHLLSASQRLSYPELSSFEYFIFVINKFTSYPYIQGPMFSLVPDEF